MWERERTETALLGGAGVKQGIFHKIPLKPNSNYGQYAEN